MEANGWTLDELAEKLNLSKNTTQKRIKYKGIEPFFTGSIYPPDTLEKIQDAKVGRPPKAKVEPEPAKPVKKGKK